MFIGYNIALFGNFSQAFVEIEPTICLERKSAIFLDLKALLLLTEL